MSRPNLSAILVLPEKHEYEFPIICTKHFGLKVFIFILSSTIKGRNGKIMVLKPFNGDTFRKPSPTLAEFQINVFARLPVAGK